MSLLYGLLICPQYHVVFLCLFVLMYDIGIKFDMIDDMIN